MGAALAANCICSKHRNNHEIGLNCCIKNNKTTGRFHMPLDNFAAIAEIVSAIAVVVTLIYLAIQIKHSKESLDANTKAIQGKFR